MKVHLYGLLCMCHIMSRVMNNYRTKISTHHISHFNFQMFPLDIYIKALVYGLLCTFDS